MIALPRVRLVARFGRRGSNLPRFVTASVLGHVLFVATILLLPSFSGRTTVPVDSLVVDLVAGAAPASASASAPAPPPEAPAEPPAGAHVATKEPSAAKKPEPPKKKKPEKKPEPKKAAPPPASARERPASAGPPGPAAPKTPAATPGAGSASITPLEAGDSELAWYRDTVTAALYAQWVKPILEGIGEPYAVSVTFDILRDGSLESLRVEQSSGIPTFDRSAQRAVADAAPFPPLPAAWGKPRLSARFLFRLYPD